MNDVSTSVDASGMISSMSEAHGDRLEGKGWFESSGFHFLLQFTTKDTKKRVRFPSCSSCPSWFENKG